MLERRMAQASESEAIENVIEIIEHVAVGIEVLVVAVIVVGIVGATYVYLTRPGQRRAENGDLRYRERLGRALLLGLEILVAADVVRTVAVDPSLESVAVLGLLVVIRTFLSWALVVEIEHRWPWQRLTEPPAVADVAGEN
jgi:uncharacterized membrane protein